MIDLRGIATALDGDVRGDQVLAPGPGHSKRDRSLSVKVGADGGFIVASFAGDDWKVCRDYVNQRLGNEVWKPQPKRKSNGHGHKSDFVATYDYCDENGRLIYQVLRKEPKGFSQRRPDPDHPGEWIWNLKDVTRLPYRLPELLASDTVFICEGEKDCDALVETFREFDAYPASCNSGGAEHWQSELNRWFKGKSIVILPDQDEPGRKHAAQVANNLHGIARQIRIIDLPNAKDFSDWLRAGGDVSTLIEICHSAPLWKPDAPRPLVSATPFLWIDPATIPPRQFVYGKHLIRKFLSTTVAPGGVGKSSLGIVEALAMASGKPLLGVQSTKRLRVWLWNGEDPLEELQRRVMAAAQHYGLTREDYEGFLFLDSGRQMPIIIAEQTRDGARIAQPIVEAVTNTITSNRIDVMSVDPFVSSHRVTENDNNAIETVAKAWANIADATDSSCELVHHVRKTGAGEATVEDGRGAVALLNAARSARVLNGMTQAEAEQAGVESERRRFYFRVDNGKANLAPPGATAWFQLASVGLANGDTVGVVTPWQWPSAFDDVTPADLRAVQKAIAAGEWRASVQAKDWAGKAVADVLELDIEDAFDKQKTKALLATWIKTGMLKVVQRRDAARRQKDFIEVGQWTGD